MGQLAFLLIGSDSLRQRWFVVAGAGAAMIALGLIILVDGMDGVTLYATNTFGLIFLLQGLFILFMVAFAGINVRPFLTVVRAVALIILACLILDFPINNEIAVTLLFGLAFIVDGGLRIATATIVRFPRWRAVVAWGVLELVLAAIIFSDWPIPRSKNIPFCMGLSLVVSGWVLMRMSLMLKNLEPEVAILALPIFAKRSWYDSAPVLIGASEAGPPEHPMTVHVWTPTGSADVASRHMMVDRYIAAVDTDGVISTGHAALECPPDIYISHYPGTEIDRDAGNFIAALRATHTNDMPGRFQPSYAVESAGWCAADQHVVFRNYNLRRLKAFWIGYRQEDTYNLTNRNCSVAVASALDAALEGALATRYPWLRLARLMVNPDLWVASMLRAHAEAMTWTPGLVLDYARVMARLVEPAGVTWHERLSDAFRLLRTRRRRRSPLPDKELAS